MKKIALILSFAVLCFGFTGCRRQQQQTTGTTVSGFDEITTVTTVDNVTIAEFSSQTVQQPSFSLDRIVVDDNNSIDKTIGESLGNADNTRKINEASGQYYDLWKAEFENVANLCKTQQISGYNNDDYNNIVKLAQKTFDETLQNGGGTSATSEANFNAGEVFKKGTYYYAAIYKQETGKDYEYLHK